MGESQNPVFEVKIKSMYRLPKKERRRTYRILPAKPNAIKVRLVLSGQHYLTGNLANISMDGAAVFFPAKDCPDLSHSDKIRLEISISQDKKTLPIETRVVGSSTVGDLILYRFRFASLDAFADAQDHTFWRLLNRRISFRVAPAPGFPIIVYLAWETGSVPGRMTNISPAGIGISVEPELIHAPGPPNLLNVLFRLPKCEFPLRMTGIVPYHNRSGERVHYGIRFVRDNTVAYHQKEAAIAAYVMRRQMQDSESVN